MNEKIKVNDFVKIIDGSYAVRVDQFEEYTSIGLSKEPFKVIRRKYGMEEHFIKARGNSIHNKFAT